MWRIAGYLSFSLAVLAPVPAESGGAWPRGDGKFFGSITWSSWGDILGYLDAIQGPLLEEPQLDMTEELALYLEYGISDRVTLGVDHYDRVDSEMDASIFFLRSNVGSLDWTDKFSAEIGIGTISDYLGQREGLVRVGLAWGRGFGTRWTDGWADVDAKYTTLQDSALTLWKVDATVGIKPNEASLWYLQLQSGALEDYPAYMRAVPTYVRRLGYGFSMESALLMGIQNDNSQGAKLGIWYEF